MIVKNILTKTISGQKWICFEVTYFGYSVILAYVAATNNSIFGATYMSIASTIDYTNFNKISDIVYKARTSTTHSIDTNENFKDVTIPSINLEELVK